MMLTSVVRLLGDEQSYQNLPKSLVILAERFNPRFQRPNRWPSRENPGTDIES